MNTSHRLIAAAKRALQAEGRVQSRIIHKHLRDTMQRIANTLGVPLKLWQGMGICSLDLHEGATLAYTCDDESTGTTSDEDLIDYVTERRRSFTIDRMTPECEALVREVAELGGWMLDEPNLPAHDIVVRPRRR